MYLCKREVNESDDDEDEEEEEEKKRRVLLSLSPKHTHTDGLSLDRLYKASASIFFFASGFSFEPKQFVCQALLIFQTFCKRRNNTRTPVERKLLSSFFSRASTGSADLLDDQPCEQRREEKNHPDERHEMMSIPTQSIDITFEKETTSFFSPPPTLGIVTHVFIYLDSSSSSVRLVRYSQV